MNEMTELIKVDFSGERPAVSARELHEFLGVGTKYADWFPRMCEYGFVKGEDFNLLKNERVQQEGGRMVSRTVDDAAISIDMAKEICMLQRNEKGKQARRYFIQLEKDWNSPEKVMARALRFAEEKLHTVEGWNKVLEADNQTLALRNKQLMAEKAFDMGMRAINEDLMEHRLQRIEAMEHKIKYYDDAMNLGGLTSLRETAMLLHISENEFVKWMLDFKYLRRGKGGKLLPRTKYERDHEYFEVKEVCDLERDWVGVQTFVTALGRRILHHMLCKRQEYPDLPIPTPWDERQPNTSA